MTLTDLCLRWMRNIPAIVFALLVILLQLAQAAGAQAVNTAQSARDVPEILQRGRLVVAMTRFDNPPFYSGTGDAVEGIDVALARSLADALGVDLVFDRAAVNFDDVIGRVADGKADIAISKISRTYRRTARVA